MATATPPPNQEAQPPNRHIPPEILEQILLNLPIKSLVRFSCVSKSWKSKISEPYFIEKHSRRPIKRIFINDNPLYFDVKTSFSCPLPHHPIAAATSFFCPFRASQYSDVILKAFCDELWCVAVKKSMFIWNPSMGTYKKLPHPPCVESYLIYRHRNVKPVYGLGYDAVNDDYKLLKLCRFYEYSSQGESFLYSLRNDSWRNLRSNGEFVIGAFHWLVINTRVHGQNPPFISAIVSFDLSTERYKEVPQPVYFPAPNPYKDRAEVIVLRGMLCVFLNYSRRRSYKDTAFVLWAMKDYDVGESWTKMYEISYRIFSSVTRKAFELSPLYLNEDGEIVIWVRLEYKDWEIVIYKHKKVIEHRKIVAPGTKVIPAAPAYKGFGNYVAGDDFMVRAGFVYVESLISPAAWQGRRAW